MLKKAANFVLAILPCSRTGVRSARQAYSAEVSYEGREELRPYWTDFFEHSQWRWYLNR